MVQFPHDEFVKEVIPELYKDYGQVIPSADVNSERREIDVLFIPDKPVPITPETLGLLGKIAQTICLIEVYRNPVKSEQIMDCLGKLIAVKNNRLKQERKEKQGENQKIMLWIITPTISKKILRGFQAQIRENWESGIYFLPEELTTAIIAVHQLPKTRATLWLRLFGRETIQFEAIEELESLPDNYPSRKSILKSVYGLLNAIKTNQKKSSIINQQSEVLIMSLRAIFEEEYAQREQQAIQKAIQKAILEGRIEGKLEGKIEGKIEGEIEGKLKTVPILIQLGMKPEEIAARLELPLESVRKASISS